ncbi:MAG: autotransporter-associated beta strand repeat-containing protein, partial [Planctomycetaceae bacterium]|nr:autotransporter-associated beta strand repeat-containing protein [Planctomycetaceae bacterium]
MSFSVVFGESFWCFYFGVTCAVLEFWRRSNAEMPFSGTTIYNLVDTGSNAWATAIGTLYLNNETTPYNPNRNDSYFYGLTTSSDGRFLQLASVANTGGNTTLTWNTGNGVWDEVTANWLGKLNGYNVYTFKDGDDVAFLSAQASGTTVTVRPIGVNPNSMSVENPGQWTFNGGKLTVAEELSIKKYASVTLGLETQVESLWVEQATVNVFSDGNVSVGSAFFGAGSHVGVAIVDETKPAITVDNADNWTVDDTAVLDITGYTIGDKALLFQTANGAFINDDLFKKVTVAGVEIGGSTSLNIFFNPVSVALDNGNQDIVVQLGGLVWYNGVTPGTETWNAHGTFNILTQFHLGTVLANNGSGNGAAFGWDGTTLTKTGGGTLYLDAVNTYTGGTVIEKGTVVATDKNALGTGDIRINEDGTLVLDWDFGGTFANHIAGDGWFIIRGSPVTIDQSNPGFTAAGTTFVSGGSELNLESAGAIGDSLLYVYGIARIFDDFDNNFSGNGSIWFIKDGLVIDYANDGFGGFIGSVRLITSLTLGHVRGFGDVSRISIDDGSTLTLDFNGRFNSPVIGTSDTDIIVQDGRLVGIDMDNSAYFGRFTIGNTAIVTITNINALGDSQTANTVKNDGILHFNFDDSGSFAKHIEGAGGVYKSGAGSLTLDGSLTYTGDTVVNGGSLIADLRDDNYLFLAHDGTTFQILSQDLALDILDGVGKVVFDGNGYSLFIWSSYFNDGEIRNVDKLTVANFLTVGNVQAKNLDIQDGAKLTLTPNHFITLENGASFGAGSVFGIAINEDGRPVVKIGDTGQWHVDPTATLDIQGYHNQPTVLFETSGDAFDGSHVFQYITVAGQAIGGQLTEEQFIDDLVVTINPDNQNQIIAMSGPLVWYNGVTPGTEHYDAHGTFKVDTIFWLDEQLDDNVSGNGAAFGWDGKTLKKTGDGVLVLGAANTYTGGTRIEGGSIVVPNANAVGTGEVVI